MATDKTPRERVQLGNVREMPYDAFVAAGGSFQGPGRLPWDNTGHGVDEDRLNATTVRKTPRHSPYGVLAAASYDPNRNRRHRRARGRPVSAVGRRPTGTPRDGRPADTQQGPRSRESARSLSGPARGPPQQKLHPTRRVLRADLRRRESRPREKLSENPEHIAPLLMDRRYPQHPGFLAEPKKGPREAARVDGAGRRDQRLGALR